MVFCLHWFFFTIVLPTDTFCRSISNLETEGFGKLYTHVDVTFQHLTVFFFLPHHYFVFLTHSCFHLLEQVESATKRWTVPLTNSKINVHLSVKPTVQCTHNNSEQHFITLSQLVPWKMCETSMLHSHCTTSLMQIIFILTGYYSQSWNI